MEEKTVYYTYDRVLVFTHSQTEKHSQTLQQQNKQSH